MKNKITFIQSNDLTKYPNMIMMAFCRECGAPKNIGDNKTSFVWGAYQNAECFMCSKRLNDNMSSLQVVIWLEPISK